MVPFNLFPHISTLSHISTWLQDVLRCFEHIVSMAAHGDATTEDQGPRWAETGMRRLIVNAYQIETKWTPQPFIMQHHVTRILNMIEYGNSWEIVRSVDLRTTWRVAPFPCTKEAIAGFVGLGRYIDVTAVPSRHFFHVLLSCTRTNKVLVLCVSVCQMINQNQPYQQLFHVLPDSRDAQRLSLYTSDELHKKKLSITAARRCDEKMRASRDAGTPFRFRVAHKR